ncbi:hypothetical protein QR680_004468 [Steinernema hermaphroditum]|uniref:Myosin motor domain-containing protein n=1 Tax=Steinernema hermaphroditum TaxID=289476 RepID=A0AA39LU13_9BILA|nr:hypothetical protein QR680_004468 [Steinernema hermaphroditum]
MQLDGNTTLGRADEYPLENFVKGARVWIRDPDRVWISASILEDVTFTSALIQLEKEDGDIIELNVTKDPFPFLRNPDILLGKDDLTSLSYLHEPAVLHNLRHRFEKREAIYTYCGIVLVAINPYADCSHMYSDEVIRVYRGVGKQVRELDPHIYAIAEEAYYDLSEYAKNQSIIVSGESGAGKTVSAKFVMRYFASVAHSQRRKNGPGIEDRVLASNPIMEAIGNAKTVRNDNSSRFGKFIQINFCERFAITGAEMKTYLLEKSRLVFQAADERNYHIFYQMCAHADHELLLPLDLKTSDDYEYTNMGDAHEIDGVDDRADFEETVNAFDLLGISREQQADIFRLLAGLLYLGNIGFVAGPGDGSTVNSDHASTVAMLCSKLYEIDQQALGTWLTAREIRAGMDVVRKQLNEQQATANRDALAKMIYASLFGWIVEKINASLRDKDSKSSSKSKAKQAAQRFIGVLDIYGFETFEINSFEQFCINYANEKLQQQFNQHVFKLEQEEYVREEISWVRIDFYDNQPCIDLIEGRPGIIDYLDEQCKMVRATDADWLNQLRNCGTIKKREHFVLPKFKDPSFMIRHFAADVSYQVEGFLEKNRDTVNEQLLEVVCKSKFQFLREIVGDATSVRGGQRKKTVSCQFRDSLKELIVVLTSTRPHYVRCIKPNDEKERYFFEPKRAIQQLRACGVLETVRISAAGYPSRWSYEDFGKRYRILYTEGGKMWRTDSKKFAERACQKSIEEDKFALGKTKIFFRTGQVARLERLRQDTLASAALRIQTIWRGFVQRRRYQQLRNNIQIIQAATRAFLAYRRIKYLQIHRSSVCIQANVRGFLQRKRYTQMRAAALAIQSHFRAAVVRRRVNKIRYEKKAIVLQKYCRGWLVRKAQIERRKKIILVQCCVRRWLAKRRLRELRIEAKSVGHLQKLNKGLENKIIELQQKLDRTADANVRLKDQCAIDEEKIKVAAAELLSEREELESLRRRLATVEREHERVMKERDERTSENSVLEARCKEQNDELEKTKVAHKANLSEMEENLENLRKKFAVLSEEKSELEAHSKTESAKLKATESRLNEMREQLELNASLLDSSSFSRAGSIRSSINGYDRNNSNLAIFGPDGKTVTIGEGDHKAVTEIQLIFNQQTMISDLRNCMDRYQRENDRLRDMLESKALVESLDKRKSLGAYEAQKIQELELQNERLKQDLMRLAREKDASGANSMDLAPILERTMEENDRRREESTGLRALLASNFERQTASPSISPRPDSGHWSSNGAARSESDTSVNDIDDELSVDRQIRQLKGQVHMQTQSIAEKDHEIDSLHNRIKDLLSLAAKGAGDNALNSNGAYLVNLAAENLSLQQKLSRQSDELKEVRAQLRGYDYGHDACSDSGAIDSLRLESLSKESVEHSALLEIFNVPEFCRILICDLKPRVARQLTPCLPSYLMLAGFRYQDHAKDEEGLTGLFSTLHTQIKDTVTRSNDLDVLVLWMVNTWSLYNLLRQYSGEPNKEWAVGNSEKQNGHRMQNFSVEPIRNQLKLRIDECYKKLMKNAIEPILTPKIVPSILQHDSANSLMNPVNPKLTRQQSKDTQLQSLDDLIEFLNLIHGKLKVFGADPVLIGQIFSQIAHWMCALALNHMMFRKDLCSFEKAIQIKHNTNEVCNWLSDKGLKAYIDHFEPLIQASHLLMSQKHVSNLEVLCGEMTSRLGKKQILAILQHYTPSDGFEEDAIDFELLRKVGDKLAERSSAEGVAGGGDQLIVPGTYLTPFDSQPFVHSDFALETLSLPACIQLNKVSRLL